METPEGEAKTSNKIAQAMVQAIAQASVQTIAQASAQVAAH